MAKVEITQSLFEEIDKTFKGDSIEVLEHLKTLEDNPKKGKQLGTVGGIAIKELRYRGFRFYFLVDGFSIKMLKVDQLQDTLLRFVRMSNKKRQQATIDEITKVLQKLGPEGFA